MASLRKKYQGLVVDNSREPVATAPTEELAKPPEPVADAPQPAEVMAKTESNPVEDAAKSELLKRVREAERAAEFAAQRQTQQQPPQEQFAEPEPETPQMDPREQFEAVIQHLPERAKGWYRQDPELLFNPERAAQLAYVHHVAARETGGEGSDEYFDRVECMMGLRNVSVSPEIPQPERQRPSAPVRPRYNGAPVSAPPTREVPSLSSGRTMNERTPLTRDEREIARVSRMTDQEYQQQKERIRQMRASGEMDA